MAQSINKPRGTLDYFGANKLAFDNLVNVLNLEAQKYGVEPIEVPVFEESKLFKRGVGESTDIVNKETFDLTPKGGHDYTLRPEFTAGINRAIIENKLYASPDLPIKFYYCGPIFRYERPQVGRFREFHQWGVEFVDKKVDLITTISCLSLFYNQVKKALEIDPILKVNFLGSFSSREEYKKALRLYFEPKIGQMCPDCQRRLEQNPLRILDCKVTEDRPIIEAAPLVTDFLSDEDKSEYSEILKALDSLNIPYVCDDKLVRGLDYYTGLVFEIYDKDNLELGALGGGGKYGHLMNDLGGPDFEGVGYSFGVERLVLARKNVEELKNSLDYFMIVLDKTKANDMIVLANKLQQNNHSVSFASMDKALTGAIKMADRMNSKTVIIADNRGYHVKNMSTRTQIDYESISDLMDIE